VSAEKEARTVSATTPSVTEGAPEVPPDARQDQRHKPEEDADVRHDLGGRDDREDS
jgi:hypothetical protein